MSSDEYALLAVALLPLCSVAFQLGLYLSFSVCGRATGIVISPVSQRSAPNSPARPSTMASSRGAHQSSNSVPFAKASGRGPPGAPPPGGPSTRSQNGGKGKRSSAEQGALKA